MNALVTLQKVRNDDIHSLRKFYEDIETNIRSLSSLGIKIRGHGDDLNSKLRKTPTRNKTNSSYKY